MEVRRGVTCSLVEMPFPVARHLAGRTRRRLVQRMVLRRGQHRTLHAFVCLVIVEPVLAGLETAYDGVAAGFSMSAGMLAGRRVATADMTAARAAPQVEPPAAAGEAFDTTVAARRYGRVNSWICHAPQPTGNAPRRMRILRGARRCLDHARLLEWFATGGLSVRSRCAAGYPIEMVWRKHTVLVPRRPPELRCARNWAVAVGAPSDLQWLPMRRRILCWISPRPAAHAPHRQPDRATRPADARFGRVAHHAPADGNRTERPRTTAQSGRGGFTTAQSGSGSG